MEWLIKAWNWLNNQKTEIGAGLISVATFWSEVVVNIWGFNPEWSGMLVQTLLYIGGILAGTGLAHKAVKAVTVK